MQKKQKSRFGQLGKRRLFLTVILAASAGAIVWFTVHPPKQSEQRIPQPESTKDPDAVSVPFYSLNLTGTARGNLSREYAAYNVSYAPQNYYTMLGTLRDMSGEVIYGTETLARSAPQKSYANQRNRLCMYLYGDTESRAESIIGPEALMRTSKGESPDFVTGDSLRLSLHCALEEPICKLLFDNGISGGCIIQDTATGRIDVMTASSISADNKSGTLWDALHLEKSGLSQLEACIDPAAVRDLGLTDEETAAYFDYHALSSVRTATDPETGNEEAVTRYHFMTDFDLLDESADGRISPLHLNSVTQRIFSGKSMTPTLIDALLRPAEDGEEVLVQPVKSGTDIPQQIVDAGKALYTRTEETESATLQYRTDELHEFLYVTGRIVTKDGAKDKCFTLYARNPAGEDTRNRCILQLPKCIAYYIAHENDAAPAETPAPETVQEEAGTEAVTEMITETITETIPEEAAHEEAVEE